MPVHFKHNPSLRFPLFDNVLIIPLSLSSTFCFHCVIFLCVFHMYNRPYSQEGGAVIQNEACNTRELKQAGN